ncbi:MAG: hypothetical protein ACJAVR_002093 [Paracoccaceae bacterium]|jgi:hypothetical protein
MLMDGVDTDGAGGGGALVANDAYAGDGGGARLEVGGALTLANVTNAGKTASGSGGTVASQGDLSITGGSVTANTAGANGGGVFATEGMVGLEAGRNHCQRRDRQWRRAGHRQRGDGLHVWRQRRVHRRWHLCNRRGGHAFQRGDPQQ